MAEILDNITELVGQTPVLRLGRLSRAHDCRTPILAKLELLSPGGSMKDRAVLSILRGAMSRGALAPGGHVLDATAGGLGISLAALCAAMGLRCTLVMPDSVSPLWKKRLEAYGAKIVLTPAAQGSAGCQEALAQLRREDPAAFVPDIFSNDDAPQAHREGTGPELLRQVGNIDYFVAGVGSGSSLTGCAESIRMQCPDCRIIAVEPFASPVLSGGFPGSHPLAGIGPGFIPDNLNLYILDEVIRVKTPDSLALMRELAEKDGLLCGPSSGAALAAAILVAQRPEAEGKTVVTLLPDSGERYLDQEL